MLYISAPGQQQHERNMSSSWFLEGPSQAVNAGERLKEFVAAQERAEDNNLDLLLLVRSVHLILLCFFERENMTF